MPYEFNENDPELEDYMWADGNKACDCTRAEMFYESRGEEDPDIDCGSELYSVQIINPETKKILYNDFGE